MAEGPGAVGRTARWLGYAGLLPQLAAVVGLATLEGYADLFVRQFAVAYACLILSFLGGIWWAIAMRRTGAAQARLAAIAVVPSLLPFAILGAFVGNEDSSAPVLISLGIALIAALAVDRRLVATDEAPANWMKLRAPLSLGLGGLTILAGLLSPH